MDVWNTIVSFWDGLFSGVNSLLVSGCVFPVILRWSLDGPPSTDDSGRLRTSAQVAAGKYPSPGNHKWGNGDSQNTHYKWNLHPTFSGNLQQIKWCFTLDFYHLTSNYLISVFFCCEKNRRFKQMKVVQKRRNSSTISSKKPCFEIHPPKQK